MHELHAEELSLSAIARELGVAKSTISRWAKEDNLAFDRSQTADAVAAKSIDLAAGRQRLAEKMLAASEDMLDRIDEPYLVYNFGGKDNDYEEHELESAPVEVRRNVITTAAITFDKLSRIVERDPDVSGAESAVRALQHGLAAVADALRPEETPQEE
ncbi:helix-turn-helix domain-containing protein [Leucobacter viscericola]|uniref:Helix-turn-helix domain-containing protein n=2 Tax=Leucobacter viscericola TaxID=2714935 RepID=A0A6G7XHC5_9MICO|nr:helix-turn-helix domain-containing protein [Leucobacter viscericola]